MSVKQRVLTIVACGPNDELALPDGNTFLRDVWQKLAPLQQADNHCYRIEKAKDLIAVRNAIVAFAPGTPPPILQIIGHGQPGELELGRSWPQPGRPPSSIEIVENNSRVLAIAFKSTAKLLAEVRLVGCRVGDVDGHPLLFSLSHHLGCDVSAASETIDASMFDDQTGLFDGAETRYSRTRGGFEQRSRTRGRNNLASPRSFAVLAPVPQLFFEEMCFARSLAALESPVRMSLSDEEARVLKQLCSYQRAPEADGSCVVELAFDVRVALPGTSAKRQPALLEVMSNKRARLMLPGNPTPHEARWNVEALWSHRAVRELMARYDQASRDRYITQAS